MTFGVQGLEGIKDTAKRRNMIYWYHRHAETLHLQMKISSINRYQHHLVIPQIFLHGEPELQGSLRSEGRLLSP
jgi:hypothetical protein